MPQSTSAARARHAQEARRKASQRNAANRRIRSKASASVSNATPAPVVGVAKEQKPLTTPTAAPEPVVIDAVQNQSMENEMGSVFDTVASDSEVDTLCELVETHPSALGSQTNSVRQLCRNRRQAMSAMGKAAVSNKGRSSRRTSRGAGSTNFAPMNANGRDIAKMRRQSMSSKGRGNQPAARPSGRVRPSMAPPKVETGTTLSGHSVTGTQVERTTRVTGNEPGTCRTVTGTEYVGTEQFDTFCETKPQPNEPKVGVSVTSAGMPVSGTEVGRSAKVTGDEQGSCASVTGAEYFGAERFSEFCETRGLNRHPAKVVEGETEKKHLKVTGSDQARVNRTTGSEAGASRAITGSQYSDAGAAKLTINGPAKVALTHTIAGRPVTGTEVGRSIKVTGDEQGSCRSVTGTEYLSNEQFSSICQTHPEPHPAKVGVDTTRKNQSITGNLLDRTEKVTGTEPGSCKHLTGSQYGDSKLCGGVAPKAHTMHTLAGRELTGNRVDHSPKLSGDERGGCKPVTGTEYYGQEQYAEYCDSTPAAHPAKVGVEHTPKGQHVSGTMVNHSAGVTGNEMGSELPVSGTPYAGMTVPGNHGACCSSCAARQMAEAAGLIAPQPACSGQAVQAQTAPQVAAQKPVEQPQYATHAAVPQPEPAIPQDFSIVSPARYAQELITGSPYGSGGRITGPINMANHMISGTPEFRYSEQPQAMQKAQPAMNPALYMAPAQPQQPVAVAQVPAQAETMAHAAQQATQVVHAVSPPAGQAAPVEPEMPVAQQQVVKQGQRVTGEGREDGINITGDNWQRSRQMTGTEGPWAQGRNPTLRGEPRTMASGGAYGNKGMERPQVPSAPVTGSSGNTNEGAIITVSGGARG